MIARGLAFALIACRADPLLEVEVMNRRLLVRDASGRLLPTFDRERSPVVRAPAGTAFEVVLEGEASTHGFATTVEGSELGPLIRTATVGLPPQRATLVVSAPGYRPARVPALWARAPDEHPEVRAIVEARARHPEEADRLAVQAMASSDPMLRLWAAIEYGRTAYARGDDEQTIARWKAAAVIAREAGAESEVIERYLTASFAARRSHRFTEAKDLVREAEVAADALRDPLEILQVHYFRGLLADEMGDHRTAERELRVAAQGAQRFPIEPFLSSYAAGPAVHYAQVGRFADAIAEYEILLSEGRRHPVDVSAYLVTSAIARLEGARAAAIPADWPRARNDLRRAIGLLRELGQRWREMNALCLLSEVEFEAGDLEAARASMAEANRIPIPLPPPGCLLAEIALEVTAANHRRARVLLERLEGRSALDPVAEERLILWKARLARATRSKDAPELFRQTLERMLRHARGTAIHSDRGPFLAERTRFIDEYIDFAVATHDLATALTAADSARSLLFLDLEADVRARRLSDPADLREWERRLEIYHGLRADLRREVETCDQRPSKEQPACRARAAQLAQEASVALDSAYALLDERSPLPSPPSLDAIVRAIGSREAVVLGWSDHRFVIQGGGVHHSKATSSLDLVTGVDRVIAVGAADLASTTLGDRPVPARVELTHVPSLAHVVRPPSAFGDRALVVGDPSGDLPGARAEAQAIARAETELLIGPAATRSAVLATLEGARLFHFAGHATVAAANPWASELVLADGPLTLEDILVQHPRAKVVVLSACGTDRTERVGLPEAFLAAGAEVVLATVRPLADAEARRFIQRFYAASGETTPHAAYRSAVASSWAAGDSTWRAFRLYGR